MCANCVDFERDLEYIVYMHCIVDRSDATFQVFEYANTQIMRVKCVLRVVK